MGGMFIGGSLGAGLPDSKRNRNLPVMHSSTPFPNNTRSNELLQLSSSCSQT